MQFSLCANVVALCENLNTDKSVSKHNGPSTAPPT